VTDAQVRQAMDFRKSAQDDNVSAVTNMSHGIGWMVEKFKIGLIQNNDNLVRDTGNELGDLFLGNECAGRIVRVGDKDDFRFRRNCVQHGLQIWLKIYRWCLNSLRTEELRDQFVGNKRVLRSDHVVAAIEKCVPSEFDHLVGAISENDILAAQSQSRGDSVPQINTAAIRIEMEGSNGGPYRGHRF